MTAETEPRRTIGASESDVQTLTPADIRHLRLRWQNRFRGDDVRAILASYPGRSVWMPGTLEFVLVGPWRHRDEIAVILDLAATRNTEAVVRAVVDRCRGTGAEVVIAIELDETRRPSFYERIGFRLLEEVITYDLQHPSSESPTGPLSFRAVDATDAAAMADLERIDHAAFPWLWRNSVQEFATYVRTPGVELFLGTSEQRAVAYVGFTTYAGWGHLDRIAVDPACQGQGFGRQALQFVTSTLVARGARSVALSTQLENVRSQRLYERFGFRRSRVNDYRLYGVELRAGDGAADGPNY